MSLCIGLTGGIASGKSTVAEEFIRLNVPVIDADQVARDVVQPGSPGLEAVIAYFGEQFRSADGSLDRALMREHLFSDNQQRKELEAILHPLIRNQLTHWRTHLDSPYGLMMVPILIEGGFDKICDRILVVDVPESVQIDRVCARDGGTVEAAKNILAAQATRAERLQRADDVIDNTGSTAHLKEQVDELHQSYLDLAQS